MTTSRFSPATLDALARWSITRGALLDASASGDDHAYLTARHDEQNAYEACCDALDADRERAMLAADSVSPFDALLEAWESAIRQNARVAGMDSLSAYHEEDTVDEETPRAALLAYLHDLETRCDPAGDVQRMRSLEEQVTGLTAQLDRRALPTEGQPGPHRFNDVRRTMEPL